MEQPAHDFFGSSSDEDESPVEDDDVDAAEALREVVSDLRGDISSRCGSWHESWGPEKLEEELKKLAVGHFWCPRRQQGFYGKRIAPVTISPVERFEPPDLSDDLVDATEIGNLEIVERWIDGGGDVNGRCIWGCTLLMHAAEYGRTDIVRYLLSRGAAANEYTTYGTTALHWACDEKTCYATSSMEAGSRPWAEVPKREPGSGPDVVKMLLDAGVSVHTIGGGDLTPLGRFLREGRSPIIATMLLRAGAMLDFTGRSAEEVMRKREEDMVPESYYNYDPSYPYIHREPRYWRERRRTNSISSDDELPSAVHRLNRYASPYPPTSYLGFDEDWKALKSLVRRVRRAGGWKRLCRSPHKEVSRLAALVARGHAEPTPETKTVYLRLFRLPTGPLLKVLSFWRDPDDISRRQPRRREPSRGRRGRYADTDTESD